MQLEEKGFCLKVDVDDRKSEVGFCQQYIRVASLFFSVAADTILAHVFGRQCMPPRVRGSDPFPHTSPSCHKKQKTQSRLLKKEVKLSQRKILDKTKESLSTWDGEPMNKHLSR
jgi:hypothetical protein